MAQQPAAAGDQQQQIPPQVGGAQAGGGQDMTSEECLVRLVQVSTALLTAQANRAGRTSMRVSDVKLNEFSGNPDPGAHYIDTEEFLPLLRWLHDCKARLATYCFAKGDKVALLVSALSGGARSVLNDLYADARVSDWSLAEAFARIAALVPDHGVLFMRRALDMKFTANTLLDDMKTFELYLWYGDVNADGSQFVWTELQNKILSSCPNLFAMAASKHNLHVAWDATKPFAVHVAQALKVVSTMQIFGDIERSTRAARAALRSGDKKRKNPPAPDNVEGKKKRSAVGKTGDDKEFSQLAFQHQLCFKCTKHQPSKDAMLEHKKHCSVPPNTLRENMKVVRQLHSQGESGVRQIKTRNPIISKAKKMRFGQRIPSVLHR